MTEHYICKGGCKGISSQPGTCQAASCPKRGEPLDKCECEDGKHFGAFEEGAEEKRKFK